MDLSQQKSSQAGTRSIVPLDKGPRRLAFRIRRRCFTFEGSPSLLISDRNGVWSVTHRRYIRKTRCLRFDELKKELDPLRIRVYESYKMDRWPQFNEDEELRSLRRKLAGFYWGLMPEEEKARTVRHYRDRRERRRRSNKEAACFGAAVVCLAVAGFVLLRLMLRGGLSMPENLFVASGFLVLAYLVDMV
ncbi:unnamed protein product [Urochloa humidicola]